MQQKLEYYLEQFLRWGIVACLFIPLVVTSFTLFPFVFGKTTVFIALTEILFTAYLVLIYFNRSYLPRPSSMLILMGIWFTVLLTSTLTGINPSHSFWSTIERREGLLLFIHLVLFFLLLVGVFRKREDWIRLFQVTVLVSILATLYALFQVIPQTVSLVSTTQSLVRPGGPLGNPVYMGSYLLFHVFFALFLFFDSEDRRRKMMYGAIAGFELAVSLFLVNARAASLGILGGLFLVLGLWTIFHAKPKIRVAFVGVILAIVAVAGFLFFKTSSALPEEGYFANRFFNMKSSFDSPGATGRQRLLEWGAALEGIRERPLFGWGLDNFTALYDRHFPPEHPYYFAGEHQVGVDRAHSIYFDWASTTGVVGLFSFFLLVGGGVWVFWTKRKNYGVSPLPMYGLIGLTGAYLIQGIFTFDTINTYIPLFLVFGFVHFLSSTQGRQTHQTNVTQKESQTSLRGGVTSIRLYILVLALLGMLVASLYFFSVKPLRAVVLAREGFLSRSQGDLDGAITLFEKSFSLNTFSNDEVRLNFANGFDPRKKEEFEREFAGVEKELRKSVEKNPHEVRYLLGLGKLYNKRGVADPSYLLRAEEILTRAIATSPTRQEIYYELGANQMLKGNMKKAEEYFRSARDLDPRFPEAWWFLGIVQLADGDVVAAKQTLDGAREKTDGYPALGGFLRTKEAYWISLVYQRIGYASSPLPYLEKILEFYPDEDTFYPILAGLYAGEGKYERAQNAARKAAEINPELTREIEEFLKYIERLQKSRE